MNNKTNYNFDVECLEAGQRRAYGDSYYHYVVKDNNGGGEYIMRNFCTSFVERAISEERRRELLKENNTADNHFKNYYTSFKKLEDGSYEYKVVSPSTH